MIRYLIVAGTAWAFAALSVVSWALTADDVNCAGCVGNKDLGKNAVDQKKLKKNGITSKKIKNRSLRRKDISPKALAGPSNVVEVATKRGDFKNPVAALDSITDASASIRYLVKIGPGVYDLGAATLQMKEYVDVQGAGPGATTLRGAVEGDPTHTNQFEFGVVTGAENASLENLRVEHTGGGVDSANAIFNEASSFVLRQVAAHATGTATDAAAAIRDAGAAHMSHVYATADSTAPALSGIITVGGNVTNAVVAVSGSAANTGLVAGPGSRVHGVDVTATGAVTNLAAGIIGPDATARNIQALASGGTNTIGLITSGGTLSGVKVNAMGGTGQNIGVLIAASTLTSVRSEASGGVTNTSLQIAAGARITNAVIGSIPVDGDAAVQNCRDVRDLNLGNFQC